MPGVNSRNRCTSLSDVTLVLRSGKCISRHRMNRGAIRLRRTPVETRLSLSSTVWKNWDIGLWRVRQFVRSSSGLLDFAAI